MSQLIVVAYDNEAQADRVRNRFLEMGKEYLIDLEDAVIAVKKPNGKVRLQQMYSLTASGVVSGGFWGALIGLIFLSPLLGLAVGAGVGAVGGALTDVGIDDAFMRELAERFAPGTSLLFILARRGNADRLLERLYGLGGTVIKTSLTHEDEAKLQAVLDGKD